MADLRRLWVEQLDEIGDIEEIIEDITSIIKKKMESGTTTLVEHNKIMAKSKLFIQKMEELKGMAEEMLNDMKPYQ